MNSTKRILATTEFILVLPAMLFMTSLLVRNLEPAQYEPARSAIHVVDWYGARPWSLGIFVIALPLTVFIIGCVALLRSWRGDAKLRLATLETLAVVRAHLATLAIAGATAVAAGILAVVAIHIITD
jgi:hypothetical protein